MSPTDPSPHPPIPAAPCASARSRTGVTRLAPSPTGQLHLGNARTFLITWALARTLGWEILLRIEDLDGPRVKPGATEQAIDTLAWLGIDWDAGPLIQSTDLAPARDAMCTLAARGLVYPSDLSRAQIEDLVESDASLSAPHEGVGEVRFPGALRPAVRPGVFQDDERAWRFVCPEGPVAFDDRFAGPQSIDPARIVGDFLVWTKRRVPAYQLAVVVDDARTRVSEVVRGDDLLDSAPRQLHLYRALGLSNEPRYTHLPLVVGPDGLRLAKRHGEARVSAYRERGVPSDAIIGLLAAWSGIVPEPTPMDAGTFARALTLARVPRDRIVFTPEHERWLRSCARR